MMRNTLTTFLLLVCAQVGFSQPSDFRAIIRSEGGIFTTHCDGTGNVLDDHTLAFIYWDFNHDGPDPLDRHADCLDIPGIICIPEFALAINFFNFPLNEDGSFASPVFRGSFGLMYPGGPCDFYIRIFFGEAYDSCYTSQVFTLITSEQLQEIVLNFASWTCGPADVPLSSCHPSSFEIYMSGSASEEECLQICPGSRTYLFARQNGNSDRPPVIELDPGCEYGCAPTSLFSFNPGAWRLSFIIGWRGPFITGGEVGCIMVRRLDRVPSAQLDTFSAIAGDNEVQLSWNTIREISLDMFELWRPAGYLETEHVANIVAENDSNGASYSFIDTTAFSQGEDYTLVMVDTNGARYAAGYTQVQFVHVPHFSPSAPPENFALHQNYPNPFNPTTTIRYDVKQTGLVSVKVFDILGREVAVLVSGTVSAGFHKVTWDAAGLPSGLYLCRMEASGFEHTMKLVLLK
ncbi:T9SS type A sorting domain-containing protein [bacterium]|nr:T9SS type A sorting domain-containing protein [bacterium]